jgi:hypothetical protein
MTNHALEAHNKKESFEDQLWFNCKKTKPKHSKYYIWAHWSSPDYYKITLLMIASWKFLGTPFILAAKY